MAETNKNVNLDEITDSILVRDVELMEKFPTRPLFVNWCQACEEYMRANGATVTLVSLYVLQRMYTLNTVKEYLEKYSPHTVNNVEDTEQTNKFASRFSTQLLHQRVEHDNWVHTVTVYTTRNSGKQVCFIDHNEHKVYPTGNVDEPWTTNLTRYRKI